MAAFLQDFFTKNNPFLGFFIFIFQKFYEKFSTKITPFFFVFHYISNKEKSPLIGAEF